jgi:hypothetical protein
MQDKMKYTEKNIQKLLDSSFNAAYKPDQQLKKETLELLLRKVTKYKKVVQPEISLVIGLFVIWIAIISLFLSEIRISIYILYLIKVALGLSLIVIPVSSFVLIILKWKAYGKKMV